MNNQSFQLVWISGGERLVIASAQNETEEFIRVAKVKALLLLADFAEDNPPTGAGRPGRSVTVVGVADEEAHERAVLQGAGHIKDLDSRVFASTSECSRWFGCAGNQVADRLFKAERLGESQAKIKGLWVEYTRD